MTHIDSTLPPPAPLGLPARVLGIVFSPRVTYAAIAAHPRALGVLVVVILLTSASAAVFLSSDAGSNAYVDQGLTMMESFGRTVNDQALQQIRNQAQYAAYTAAGFQLVFLPLMAALVAGLSLGVFNAVLGGDASFRQAFAVVSHSYVVLVMQSFFSLPLNFMRESLSSTTTLSIFFPMVDNGSFAGQLLGSIDLFRIWWILSLSIGLGVLYKKRTAPTAWSLLALYLIIALLIAGVRSAFSGA